MALAAGRLRHRVIFQRLVNLLDSNGEEIQNEAGEILKEWQYLPTITTPDHAIWCAIEPLRGAELIASQQKMSKVSGNMFAKRRTDIDATCRGIHNGTIYQIEAVEPDPDSGLEHQKMPFTFGTNDGQ